jgi:hypothetical protein
VIFFFFFFTSLSLFSKRVKKVCKMVNHKLKLPYSRVADTAVVMVHKVQEGKEEGHIRHLLRTLRDDERPVDLHRDAMQKYHEVKPLNYIDI